MVSSVRNTASIPFGNDLQTAAPASLFVNECSPKCGLPADLASTVDPGSGDAVTYNLTKARDPMNATHGR